MTAASPAPPLGLLTSILWETWNALLVAAPFLLLGLFAAGLLHVLLPRRVVERWMGREDLAGVIAAALFGIPLPLCSCGVVPVVLALRRKGASRPASASFLISTPESGVDSILLTYGMFGPVMAIARPLASFVTALVAGAAVIAWPGDRAEEPAAAAETMPRDDEAFVVGLGELARSLWAFLAPQRASAVPARPFETIIEEAVRYGFIDLLDDIVFWLVIGLALAGIIAVLVPADLGARGLGAGLTPMLLMLVIGVPLYICASASTPVAAALVAKGLSPGAALVFLLAGPATNAATLVLLTRQFGLRFVRLYLTSIAVATLACGLGFDWLLVRTGWSIHATLSGGIGGTALVQWLSAAIVSALMAWRLWAGAAREGARETRENLESLLGLGVDPSAAVRRAFWRRALRRLAAAGIALALAAYAMAGVRIIPPESRGYGFLFGRLRWPDLAPGAHFVPPWPFGRCDVWRVDYPRIASVGFRSELSAVTQRRQLTRAAGANLWHSPITAANTDEGRASYLTGDGNLIEISFVVQYDLSDATAYFYRVDKDRDSVALYAEAAAHAFVAEQRLDDLLTSGRAELETAIAARVQAQLDRLGAGARITAVLVVDIHPPQGAVDAFRDVSSAREDRETAINVAATEQARAVPVARGQAAIDLATAQAGAVTAERVARGRAEAFQAQARAFALAPAVLGDVLWLEGVERVLAGREKMIVPPGAAGERLAVWKNAPRPAAAADQGSPAPKTAPLGADAIPGDDE